MRIITIGLIMILAGSMSAQKGKTIISYKKGACMGKCPVYSITVDEKGLLTYHGIVNVDKIGLYSRQLTTKEFKKVKRKFRRAKFHKLDEEYGMDVMDAAMTTFVNNEAKENKKITVKLDMPKRLIKAEGYIKSLVTESAELPYTWKKEVAPRSSTPQGRKEMAERMIIVQLNAGVEFNSWAKKYKPYNVRLIKKIVPNRPLYLVAFNHATIQLPQLLKKMKVDEAVHTAEENKQVKMR